MASESPNSQKPDPELSTPVDKNEEVVKHDATNEEVAKGEATNDITERPFFAPSEPMREDQVQNAVKFLLHPKVRGSPVIYRRSFLEKKGLTKEEIDEAFHRVPDPPPANANSVATPATNQASIQPTSLQPQASIQSLQLAAPVSSVSMVPSVQQSKFHWSHALIAVGLLCASGCGSAMLFKNVVVPRLKTWIRKVVSEENVNEKEDKPRSALLEQTTEAAKAAATAAAVVAKASEELLNSKNEEKKYLKEFINKMDMQVKEMKSMGEAIRKLESRKENDEYQDKLMKEYMQSSIVNGTTNNPWKTSQAIKSTSSFSSVAKQIQTNGTANPDYASVRPSSAPATVEPTTAPHPKSFMEIMAMIERGEKPSNIREINDMPPNPNQQPSKPALAPRPKPWERSQQSTESENNKDSSEPWWKKKTVKITQLDSEASNTFGHTPSQRAWVPPQPPAVTIPEAAAAIRQPKKYPSSEIAHSNDGEDTKNETHVESNESEIKGENSVEPIEDASKIEKEVSAEPVKYVRIEPRSSSTVFAEQIRSEIEVVREDGVETS